MKPSGSWRNTTQRAPPNSASSTTNWLAVWRLWIAEKLSIHQDPRQIAEQVGGAPEATLMSGYLLGVEVDLDLDEFWEYIAADKIDAADRWVGKLFDAFEALARSPGMGHRRLILINPTFAANAYFWPKPVSSSN